MGLIFNLFVKLAQPLVPKSLDALPAQWSEHAVADLCIIGFYDLVLIGLIGTLLLCSKTSPFFCNFCSANTGLHVLFTPLPSTNWKCLSLPVLVYSKGVIFSNSYIPAS